MMIVYTAINENINREEFERILCLVSEQKQRKVLGYHKDIDRKLSLYSEVLVRLIACKILGIRNNEINFGKGKFGKPFIKNIKSFYFNVSHTRNAIAVAFLDMEVGVDIEMVRSDEYDIAERFFTASEFKYIYKDNIGKEKRFFEIWTKKEAYIKYVGKGLTIPLNSFSVVNGNPDLEFYVTEIDDYIISVCRKKNTNPMRVLKLNENDLVKRALTLENISMDFSTD